MRWTPDHGDRRDEPFGRREYDDGVSMELLTASIAAAVDPVKSELAWHKWLLLALLGAILMPKIGGPSASVAAGAMIHPDFVVWVVRQFFS